MLANLAAHAVNSLSHLHLTAAWLLQADRKSVGIRSRCGSNGMGSLAPSSSFCSSCRAGRSAS